LLSQSVIIKIAAKRRKTPAQVVIRWHLDSGLIVIPKTVRLERLRENIGALDFRLDDDDMRRVEALDSRFGRIGANPAPLLAVADRLFALTRAMRIGLSKTA
jgi:2,5-diketo-D-gluconate reductase A